MKKILNIILVISITISFFVPITNVYAACTYQVATVKSDGIHTNLDCYGDYEAAKAAMYAYNSNDNEVSIIKNIHGQILNAEYAIARFEPGNVINLYPTASSNTKYTSIHTSYGAEAAFIDYEPISNRVKVRISGYTGWTNLGAGSRTIRINTDYGRSNVRSEPTITSQLLGKIESGEIITYIAKGIEDKYKDSTYTWYQISYPDEQGNPRNGYIAEKTNDSVEWITELNTLVNIIPISLMSGAHIKGNVNNINVYSSANTGSSIIGDVDDGYTYKIISKTNVNSNTWYQINYKGNTGYVLLSNSNITEVNTSLQTNYQAWNNGNLYHYYEYYSGNNRLVNLNNLSNYPSFLVHNNVYYSFDGNYFYNDLINMLTDYRNGNYNNSINLNTPYYPYYLYLPTHSISSLTAADFDNYISKTYTRNKEPGVTYYTFNESTGLLTATAENRVGISLLYGMGQNFINAANTYGINSLMMFSTAINESTTGTSAIAFYKNNLFGLGAYDSNPVVGAKPYATVNDSIVDFAKFTGFYESSYSNPNGSYFFGSHYGNKGSGMNVNYATDPYWGEKQAKNTNTLVKDTGGMDYLASTIGVTRVLDTKVYKNPNVSSNVLYTLKNINKSVYNIPITVFDKVTANDGTVWYKVYTDVALNENRDIADVDYSFANSYGYIKESDLFVNNNQPVINANDITIRVNEPLNLMSGVTASDIENGNLTSKITVSGNVDNLTEGIYYITYRVVDNSNFEVNKSIKVTVIGTDEPVIRAYDKEISQYTSYDPREDVVVSDLTDGDLTDKVEIVDYDRYPVNTNLIGVYPVTYKVTNSLGKVTIKTINVYVRANNKPVIHANDKVISLNNIFDNKAGVTATDIEDGDLTSSIIITSNNVDVTKPGIYYITYQVSDKLVNSSDYIITKTIKVTVEDKVYTQKAGDFYFNKLSFENNKLVVEGSLAITGMNNNAATNITYDIIFKDNYSTSEYIIPLNRWLNDHPTRGYTSSSYDYTKSWFNGAISLNQVPEGEYTLYVRARSGSLESRNLFRNVFAKTMTRKAVDTSTNRGYLFRNNNYKKTYPIEVFISNNSLISTITPPHASNMFNNYDSLNLNNGFLNIVGRSYNIGVNYSSSATVERSLILENKDTKQRYTYDIGSYVGTEVPLRVSDGLSKVRAWFNTDNKIDLKTLPIGNYNIYIKTKVGNIEDYGELNDVFMKGITNPTVSTVITTGIYDSKSYTISLNKDARFRLELSIKN